VRAEVAAVAIAAFEAQLGGLELAPPPAPPPPAPSPPPLSPPAAAVVATSPPPPDAVPVSFEVGAAVLVSLDGRDAAPAARADAKVRPGAGPWAFAVAATGVGKHWLDVSGGHGTWRRLGGELAVVREIGTGEHARLEVRAGLALALIDIQGNGYRRNLGATLFDQGAVMGLRFAPFAWRVRPWLDVAGTYWPRVHQVSVDTAPFPGAVEHNYGVGPAQTLRLTPAR
jgi:hypothetical protein